MHNRSIHACLAGAASLSLTALLVACSSPQSVGSSETTRSCPADARCDYDPSGRVTRADHDRSGDGRADWTHLSEYDGQGRLRSDEYDWDGDGRNDLTLSYRYDDMGNLRNAELRLNDSGPASQSAVERGEVALLPARDQINRAFQAPDSIDRAALEDLIVRATVWADPSGWIVHYRIDDWSGQPAFDGEATRALDRFRRGGREPLEVPSGDPDLADLVHRAGFSVEIEANR